jgi:hypothetical protein
MPITMTITAGVLPEGFCATSEQSRFNTFAQYLTVTFPATIQTYNYGSTVPTPDQQSFPWFRINADGTPDKWYVYAAGYWLSLHPTPASSPEIRFYDDTFASIDTYDGGEVGGITSITGPMWQVATTDGLPPTAPPVYTNWLMPDRTPVGVGSTFSLAMTGGEISHTLTIDEIPAHSHSGTTAIGLNVGGAGHCVSTNDTSQGTAPLTINNTGGGIQHNNMPPYYAGYWIKRTSRIYYRV